MSLNNNPITAPLPNNRIGSDWRAVLTLKDNGVAVDWSTLDIEQIFMLSESQAFAFAGLCEASVDAEDPTRLNVVWKADKQLFQGIHRIVAQVALEGFEKTYDKRAVNIVPLSDSEEDVYPDDPTEVELEVVEVDTSIMTAILRACQEATKEATEVADTAAENEIARVAAEASRISAEAGRVAAESARATAESGRSSAESARATAEGARATAESSRASAESERAEAEVARDNAEADRAYDERARQIAEDARQRQETLRQQSETARADKMIEFTRRMNENQELIDEFTLTEQEREEAELARQTAEASREAAEGQRALAFQAAEAERSQIFAGKEAERDAAMQTISQEAAKLSELEVTKYMLSPDGNGNNVFVPNYVRHGKIVRSSAPYDIFNFNGAGVTGFYRVPTDCVRIQISGIVASGTLLVRLSKTPQDNSDSIPYWLNADGTRTITIDDSNRDYPYLCVGAYRVSGSDTPDMSNVKIAFYSSNARMDAVETSITELKDSTKGLSKQLQNNVWKTFGDESTLDNIIAPYSNTRRQVYDCFRSVKFFGCDKSIPRTMFVVWKKATETEAGNIRISRYNSATNSWTTEFIYAGVLSEGITENGVCCIKINNDVNGDTTKKVELLIDLSQMPNVGVSGGYVLNPLTSTPERVFSETCYFENTETLPSDVAALSSKVSNLELDVDKLEKGFVYGADLFTINGFIDRSTGKVLSHQTLKCTDFLPVQPGQVYTTLVGLGGTACNGFYDENKVFVGYWNAASEVVGTMTIPANAHYMRLSSRNVASPYASLNNPPFKGIIELTDLIGKASARRFKHKTRRNTSLPVIAFSFDDCHSNDALIVDLFDQYGLTCGFAFIASVANITAKGDLYRSYQDRGYDILNHSVDGKAFNTTNYTLATATNAVATAMERMEKVGIIANGFVAPSSTMDNSFIPMLRKFHSFACLYGGNTPNASNTDVCKLTRYSLHGNSLATIKASIDSAIANNSSIIFYSHSADFGTTYPSADNEEWNIAKLQAVLEYCIAKRNNGDCFLGSLEDCLKSYYDIY